MTFIKGHDDPVYPINSCLNDELKYFVRYNFSPRLHRIHRIPREFLEFSMFREIPEYSRFSRFSRFVATMNRQHVHTYTNTHSQFFLNRPILPNSKVTQG